MRIEEIRVRKAGIQSSIRNAVISFSEMTLSVVRIRFDHGGKTVDGYGFCSNGRYAQNEIIEQRFVPRILASNPDHLLDESGLPDPLKIWDAFMQNEKPGGHGDRAVAAGALDMAVWDGVAKLAEKPLWHFFLNVSMRDSLTRRCSSIPEEAIIIREKKSPDFRKNSKDTSTRDTVILR
ncbi:MAG: hypothetical protein CM15mP45_12120 [Deltaproteobacteria bacterium]|nr:MAG: hypothetical protein CM15mP45_12120 [Deltaproteobacteria bacterium]